MFQDKKEDYPASRICPIAEKIKPKIKSRTRNIAKLCFNPIADKTELNITSNGIDYKFLCENKGKFNWNGNVDLIGDISGSMNDALSYDVVMNEKNTEKWLNYPRIKTQEFIYKQIRKNFVRGKNYVFSDNVYNFDIEHTMKAGGGTDLQNAINKCDPNSITVIFTDDKGGVNLSNACNPMHKMIIVVLLTSYSLVDEYNSESKDEVKQAIRCQYRFSSGTESTNPRDAPSFGTALLSQRDNFKDFIQVESAYNEDGTKLSDQKTIIDSITNAINQTVNHLMISITNTYKSDFIVQCPSGTTLSIPGNKTTITCSPLITDFEKSSILYVHSPAE